MKNSVFGGLLSTGICTVAARPAEEGIPFNDRGETGMEKMPGAEADPSFKVVPSADGYGFTAVPEDMIRDILTAEAAATEDERADIRDTYSFDAQDLHAVSARRTRNGYIVSAEPGRRHATEVFVAADFADLEDVVMAVCIAQARSIIEALGEQDKPEYAA